MLMRKFGIMSVLPVFLLSSCGSFNPYGTYEFRLGKTDGSHLEVSATLLNEDYEKVEGMKKMFLTADLGEDFSISKIMEQYGEEYPILEPFIDSILEKIGQIDQIEMYYKILDDIKNEKYGNRLAIGSDFLEKLIKEIIPDIESLFPEGTFDLSPETLQNFFVAYINDKNLTFQIPVSMDDIKYQLTWYGRYVDDSGNVIKLDMDKMPGPKDDERYGVHPKVEKDQMGKIINNEIDLVNEAFKAEFSNTPFYITDENSLEKKIGRFVVDTFNENKVYLYLDEAYTGSHDSIEGYIYEKDLFGKYNEKHNMKLSVDENSLTNLVFNQKEEKDAGVTDMNGEEFKFSLFVQEPFVFRDFHDVKVGLAKV